MREGGERRLAALAVPAALAVSSLLVWSASRAAVVATVSAAPDAWAAGSVTLTEDASGAALFTVTGLVPGDTGSRCLTVTYSGDLAARVRLYVSASSGTLGQYLDLTVEEGTGGTADCTGFVPAASLTAPATTVAAFATAHGSFGTGVSTWAPTGAASESRTYRFVYTLQGADAAQGQTGSATFRWEAQTT